MVILVKNFEIKKNLLIFNLIVRIEIDPVQKIEYILISALIIKNKKEKSTNILKIFKTKPITKIYSIIHRLFN